MDPLSIFGGLSGGIQVVQAIVSTLNGLRQLYGKIRGAEMTIQSLIWELNSTKSALQGLQEWSQNHYYGAISDQVGEGLAMTLDNCAQVVDVLSIKVADLIHGFQSGEGMGWRTRVKAVWNEEMMKGHQDMLRGQVLALHMFLQLFQW